jgi:malate/lactate dehydrogenase
MKNKMLPKNEVDAYMKTVSKLIVDNIGGTEYGPAASFRDITRAITKDTRETLSIAAPFKFKDIPESVFVGMPTRLGKSVGPTLFENLSDEEKDGIATAAKAIYQTYLMAIENLEM